MKKEINERNRKRRRGNKGRSSTTTITSFLSIVSTYLSASLCVRWTLTLTLHSRQIPDRLIIGEDIEVEVDVEDDT